MYALRGAKFEGSEMVSSENNGQRVCTLEIFDFPFLPFRKHPFGQAPLRRKTIFSERHRPKVRPSDQSPNNPSQTGKNRIFFHKMNGDFQYVSWEKFGAQRFNKVWKNPVDSLLKKTSCIIGEIEPILQSLSVTNDSRRYCKGNIKFFEIRALPIIL